MLLLLLLMLLLLLLMLLLLFISFLAENVETSVFTVSTGIKALLHFFSEHSYTPLSVVDALSEICTKFT